MITKYKLFEYSTNFMDKLDEKFNRYNGYYSSKSDYGYYWVVLDKSLISKDKKLLIKFDKATFQVFYLYDDEIEEDLFMLQECKDEKEYFERIELLKNMDSFNI